MKHIIFLVSAIRHPRENEAFSEESRLTMEGKKTETASFVESASILF